MWLETPGLVVEIVAVAEAHGTVELLVKRCGRRSLACLAPPSQKERWARVSQEQQDWVRVRLLLEVQSVRTLKKNTPGHNSWDCFLNDLVDGSTVHKNRRSTNISVYWRQTNRTAMQMRARCPYFMQ